MNARIAAAICAAMMACAAGAAVALAPTAMLANVLKRPPLSSQIVESFGDWQLDKSGVSAVVNPQAQAVLDKIYSDIASLTYVNRDGYRIMLSIAYGRDQRDAMQLHYPEVCYPAQGFTVQSNHVARLDTALGAIDVRRLVTDLGGRRPEPVTYWTTVGNKAVLGGLDKKFAEMSYGFAGIVPDGLLFRVSSIDPDTARAFTRQEAFVREFLAASTPAAQARFAGLGPLALRAGATQ